MKKVIVLIFLMALLSTLAGCIGKEIEDGNNVSSNQNNISLNTNDLTTGKDDIDVDTTSNSDYTSSYEDDPIILRTNDLASGNYVLKEHYIIDESASSNTDIKWKKMINGAHGEVVVQTYDQNYNRFKTELQGYDIRGKIQWKNVPDILVLGQTYTISISLTLSHYYNPELATGATVGVVAQRLTIKDDGTMSASSLKDDNGNSSLVVGLTDGVVKDGGILDVRFTAPSSDYDRIGLQIYSSDGFRWIYIYEWID